VANQFYQHGSEAFLEGSIAYLADTINVDLVSSASYTPNFSTDQYHSTITGSGGIIAAGVALTSKTGSGGTASAANTVWSAVSGGAAAYIIVWKSTGTDSTSPLIGLIDTATGLPVTPNGGDITAAWSSGQIFTLRTSLAARARDKAEAQIRRRWEQLAGALWRPTPAGLLVPQQHVSVVGMIRP
jgi:hypothetical protein